MVNFIYMWNEREVKCESSARNNILDYRRDDSFFSVTYVENVSRHRAPFPARRFSKGAKRAYKAQALHGRMSRIKTN